MKGGDCALHFLVSRKDMSECGVGGRGAFSLPTVNRSVDFCKTSNCGVTVQRVRPCVSQLWLPSSRTLWLWLLEKNFSLNLLGSVILKKKKRKEHPPPHPHPPANFRSSPVWPDSLESAGHPDQLLRPGA